MVSPGVRGGGEGRPRHARVPLDELTQRQEAALPSDTRAMVLTSGCALELPGGFEKETNAWISQIN